MSYPEPSAGAQSPSVVPQKRRRQSDSETSPATSTEPEPLDPKSMWWSEDLRSDRKLCIARLGVTEGLKLPVIRVSGNQNPHVNPETTAREVAATAVDSLEFLMYFGDRNIKVDSFKINELGQFFLPINDDAKDFRDEFTAALHDAEDRQRILEMERDFKLLAIKYMASFDTWGYKDEYICGLDKIYEVLKDMTRTDRLTGRKLHDALDLVDKTSDLIKVRLKLPMVLKYDLLDTGSTSIERWNKQKNCSTWGPRMVNGKCALRRKGPSR
ncbi:hypothetical protein QBC38DRAFT_486775 [Podospora fimiseda]|uniref:Uncharacterized protein n=1 Tax=Podospora fimiseda TaxID=252190 RepID=A0AAN7GPG7_9PEZI|nr:hypothetical protein QBC38DRAFT_486775 [Podospora fimiseda]